MLRQLNQLFRKNTGLSPYVWIVFYILPFYFVFYATYPFQIAIGIAMIIAFFIFYLLSFVSKGWLVYFWTSIQIVISTAMTLLFAYVYFSLFLAFFIGNLKNRITFLVLYSVHLICTLTTINYNLATQNQVFITQLPFVLLSLIAVILLPVNTYNKNRSEQLLGQLEDANKRIADLVKLEERQRISRDLHDTLGQKLSLIGLKSDLAGKLIYKNPRQAQTEMNDVRQTARTALKEVRALITRMRGTKLEDELRHVRQLLDAAQIEFTLEGNPKLENTSLIAENVVSMCLKEVITNVVKHSQGTSCTVVIEPLRTELVVRVVDNGVGMANVADRFSGGYGLRGIKERLEFVNGGLDIVSDSGQGTVVTFRVPNVTVQRETEEQNDTADGNTDGNENKSELESERLRDRESEFENEIVQGKEAGH